MAFVLSMFPSLGVIVTTVLRRDFRTYVHRFEGQPTLRPFRQSQRADI
jgi:hypothetical protein